MADNKIIEVKDLTVRYGDRTILENVNFQINRGEIFVIVGGSGCGKSTLLRQLIGLETPTKGDIFFENINFTSADKKQKNQILRRFGVLFQSSGLFASMTLAENIALVLEKYTDLPEDKIEKIIEMKLDAVGLNGFQDFLPSEISGGMKKRAAFARSMALDPDVLFFDEPSSGLDPVTSASLDELIVQINRGLGTTMVIVSHDLASILSVAHRIIMLDKSQKGIIATGTPDELRNSPDERVYNFFNRIAS
ncbi:MAG: ATP-binding cassette domain-containing protein [Ignavibacteria bacterium]|nr:ATP-binding cassette domain-containing protein [Ignavibacteria bacterium]